jgi:hypothetical protein
MNAAMYSKREDKIPIGTGFLQHPNVLQHKVCDEVLHLKDNQEPKK